VKVLFIMQENWGSGAQMSQTRCWGRAERRTHSFWL